MLTGKYASGPESSSGRIASNLMYATRYRDDWAFAAASSFAAFARERGWEPAALAVAWVASHPAVTAPLIGARNLSQLDGSLAALEIEMTPALRAEISAFSPNPAPATDRTEEGTVHAMLMR